MIIIRNINLPSISRFLSRVGVDENKVVYEVRLSKSAKRIGLAVAFGLCLNATVYVFDYVQPAHAVSNNVVINKIIGRT
tara:strand:- start:160 stop:396 length:237 start_codon:yes stop_codon:yes gene_type:complete